MRKDNLTKTKIWIGLLAFIVFCFGVIAISLTINPITLRFELDDNALEAIKLGNEMQERQYNQTCHSEGEFNQYKEALQIQTENLDNSRQMEMECMDDLFACQVEAIK